jgi:hypothetical protein
MKKIFTIKMAGGMKISSLFLFVLALCCFVTNQSIAQTISSNQVGNQGGYTYEFWKDNGGSGSMTLGSGGAFSVSWSGINNILARKGLRPGSKNQTVTYSASYNPSGNSYLCVYGWFTSPLVEYYIVDSWGSWRPPGASSVGTVSSDGGTYDLYRTQRVNQPSIQGTATFYQYWSVRTSKRTSGTITVANHFNAWQSRGWTVGSMYEVSLTVEGYQSSGNANVTSMSMGTGGTTNPPGGGSSNIVVRARGVNGSESIRLTVGNTQVGSWTLGTSMQNYSVTTSNTGGINVEYTNDASNRDVQVDYITVNGTTRQAENQTTNTGVYQNGACGGSNSEWLHCNGYIGFGNTPSTGRSAIENVVSEEPAPNPGFSIYPNPAKSNLSIELPENIVQLSIMDYSGKAIRTIPVNGKRLIRTDLNLKPGIYIVKIENGSMSEIRKLVVE